MQRKTQSMKALTYKSAIRKCNKCFCKIAELWNCCPSCGEIQNDKSFERLSKQNYLSMTSKLEKLQEKSQQNLLQLSYTNRIKGYKGISCKNFILSVILGMFFYFLLSDLKKLKQEEINKVQIDIIICRDNFSKNNCIILLNSPLTDEVKQRECYQWQYCMEQDPNEKVIVIQLLITYLAVVMSQSLEIFSSLSVGMILLACFGIVVVQKMLDSICPKRKYQEETNIMC